MLTWWWTFPCIKNNHWKLKLTGLDLFKIRLFLDILMLWNIPCHLDKPDKSCKNNIVYYIPHLANTTMNIYCGKKNAKKDQIYAKMNDQKLSSEVHSCFSIFFFKMSFTVNNLLELDQLAKHNDKKLCIVDFHSTICGHGKTISHQLVNLVKKYGLEKVIFINVNVDEQVVSSMLLYYPIIL